MVDVPAQTTHGSERQVWVRYFLRANRASQMKKPIVKSAKPKNATSCSVLALASENPVSASMVSSSSAGNGADHVHDEFKTQEHQVNDRDPEDYLNAQHGLYLRLRNGNQPIRPGPTPPQ
jgi:hypothetical protein